VPSFLICVNPACRTVIDLRSNGSVMRRSELALDECPDCGSQWSSDCPFCGQPLEIQWRASLPHCLNCTERLQAKQL
jgi:transcription elongation factor Elf1